MRLKNRTKALASVSGWIALILLGLSVPVARWLNTDLAPLADRLLRAPRLGAERVPRLLAEHRAGRANHARKLWPILMAELWADRWNVDLAPG